MHKLNVFVTISILLIATLNSPIFFSTIALSQEGSNATTPTPSPTPTDLCAGVTCQPTKTTCPDGFVASCTPTCDSSTGKCGACTPSCTGHEKQQETTTSCPTSKTCPDGKTTVACKLVNNACTCDQCPTAITATCGNNVCESGESTACPSDCEVKPKPCPLFPVPSCQAGQTLQTKTTPDGCSVSECVTPTTCAAQPKPPVCGETQGVIQKFDDKGCITGYECKEISKAEVGKVAVCPEVPPPTITCRTNEQLSKATDDKGCVVGYNCVSTAPSLAEAQSVCPTEIPEKPSCDGSLVPNFDKGCLTGYTCVPQGCRQETDASGFVRVVCKQERVCHADEQQAELKSQCFAQGGNPVPFQDPSGCTFYDCRFDERGIKPNPISGHQSCPTPEEIHNEARLCKEAGLTPSVTFEGGCKIAKCSQESGPVCKYIPESEKTRIHDSCGALPFIQGTDNNGCVYYTCGKSLESCQRDVPAEAYKSCDGRGGEMIVKNDKQGCVVFSQCVAQGDDKHVYVKSVEEVPDATVLLSLALKLEQLKIELEKLGREAGEIAKYYASTGSVDEERYNRVSSMFGSAAERIDEIKIKIRDNVDGLTTDDLEEIRHDIKYIKEVTLKDILYLMLSNSDDVKETLETSRKISGKKLSAEELKANTKSCGTDGFCFDKGIRSCKPVSFQPEGRHGPSMTIKGLENDRCVLHVIMQSEDMIPPGFTKDSFYMDCPIQNYAFGIRGPEDVIPHCEGPMAKFAKQFGGGAEISGGDTFQDIIENEGGPGGCTSEKECATYCLDNYDECKEWIKDHPAVGPIPSREELRRYASGEEVELREKFREQRKSVRGFSGPGGCQGPQECDKFCRNNPDECLRWCDENPDICPKPRGEFKERHQRKTKPAIVQGEEWDAKFERPSCTGCLSDKFKFAGEPIKGAIELEGIKARGDVEIVQFPSQENGFETIILFDDDDFDGPDFYEIKILPIKGAEFEEFRFRDCIDGSDYLIIKGNTVQYEHRNFENPGEHRDCALIKEEFKRGVPRTVPGEPVSRAPEGAQACVGCLNNGVCDIGECSECGDCLKGGRSITSEIVRRAG